MKQSAIRKLLMINTGVYGYAEVDLQGSVHLAGDNNLGKTSLIHAFQFFFVDDWNLMRFDAKYSKDETRRYYFKENSYILIEVDTPSGIKLVGLRGLGPQKNHEYERFVVSGAFEKAIFFDGDKLRDWEDISQNSLAPRVLKPQTKLILDRKELRNAMMGSGESAGVRIELAPPANYDAFVKMFLNLLTLKRATETDMKAMLLDSLGSEIELRALDLASHFTNLTKGIQAHGHSLKLLEDNESEARKLEKDYRTYRSLVAGLPEDWVRLNEGIYKGMHTLRGAAEALEARAEELGETLKVLLRDRREVYERIEVANRQKTQAETRLEQLDVEAAKFQELPLDQLRDKVRQLGDALEPLRGQLALQTSTKSRSDLDNRLQTLADSRKAKEVSLANPEASWSARILGECDEPQRETVIRFIRPEVLALPEGSGGVTIKDEDKLFREISDLHSRVKDGIYEDGAIRADLRSIRAPKSGVFDPIILEREIEAIQAEETQIRRLLAEVGSVEKLRREITGLESQWNAANREVILYQEWRAREAKRPSHSEDLQKAERELGQLGKERSRLEQGVFEMEGEIRESRETSRRKTGEADALKVEWEAHQVQQNQEWVLPESETVGDIPAPEDLKPLLEDYRKRLVESNSKLENIKVRMAALQTVLGSLVAGGEMDAAVAQIKEQMDTIPDRQKTLQDEKTALVSQASRRFADFYRGFESVKAWVSKLNRGLSEVQVSDLRSIEIKLVPSGQAGIIEGFVNSQTSPLFASDRVDEAVKRIVERMEEKQVFHLEDLFGIHIRVVKANGETKIYDKLDTESTGTAMTFKVVLIARMIRELAKMRGSSTIRLPLFVDEADTLDDPNRTTILNLAEKLGFGVVMASPNAVPAHRVYLLHASGGRTWITLDDEHLLLEREADETAEEVEVAEEVVALEEEDEASAS